MRVLFDFGVSHSFIIASCVKDLGLEVETLEEPLHVSSPLGTRVRVDKICWDCELDNSGILLTMDLLGSWTCRSLMSSLGWIGWRHTVSSLIVIVGGLLLAHKMMFVLCLRGRSTMLYPKSFTILDGTGN